jgi:hypothetical protein
VTLLKYLVNAYDYFTITVLQCEAVRKNTKSEIRYNENCKFILNIPMVFLFWFVRSKVVMVVIVSTHSVVWNDTNHINILMTKKVKYSELNCRNVITTNCSHPSFVENK